MRAVLVTAMALTVSVAVAPVPASAASLPPAPYDALVLDGGDGQGFAGTRTFDRNNATFTGSRWSGTDGGLALNVDSPGRFPWYLILKPPVGKRWVPGTRYVVQPDVDVKNPEYATVQVSGDGRSCGMQVPGSILVREAVFGADNLLTAFAGSFSVACGYDADAISGEVRWHSSVGYTGSGGDAPGVDFGRQALGVPGQARTVTFTAVGSEPTRFGAPVVSGANPAAFAVSGTCANATLTYGQTCTVKVVPTPSALTEQSAKVTIPDNSVGGRKVLPVKLVGVHPKTVALDGSYLWFGNQEIGASGEPQKLTVTSSGIEPVTFGPTSIGGDSPAAYTVTSDGCGNRTIAAGDTCSVSVVARPTRKMYGYETALLQLPNDSTTNPVSVQLTVNGIIDSTGAYYPITPRRILDSRAGIGAGAKVSPGQTVSLMTVGDRDVPRYGVGAVALNVTVTEPTSDSFVTVYPSGVPRPDTSSLNIVRGWTGANSVTVAVGEDGRINLYNQSGQTHLIVDIVGYFAKDDVVRGNGAVDGGHLLPVRTERLFDSRSDWGEKLAANHYLRLPVSYGADIDPHIRALVVNITATEPDGAGFLTAWSGTTTFGVPFTSTLNYTKGANVPNMAIVPTAPCVKCGGAEGLPSIGVHTSTNTHVVVDIVAVFDDGTLPGGLLFRPITPTRIADSRIGQGTPTAIGPGGTANVVAPPALLADGTKVLALNLTAIAPTDQSYLTVWPNGGARPTVSNLNPYRNQIIPNAAVTRLGTGGSFNIFNFAGTTHVAVDVVGTYYEKPAPAAVGPLGLRSPAPELRLLRRGAIRV
ncbi:choice-of-anchor D domain-containing protein [Longispora sp. NPDC051575]|uniref:choice-of-anchor D domain-containing protein n=1 Tax=Longispora sp. NPDC051575 TaxID=3154943 RepID=UPI00342D9925